MIDGEVFKFKIQYLKAEHQALLAIFYADTPNRAWLITLSDGAKIVGDGFLTEFSAIPKAANDVDYENNVAICPVAMWTVS
jgi:hypothetical protein